MIVDQFNREIDAAVPTGMASAAAEKLTGAKGMTLKVDGVLLAPSDKVPTGDVYEVVEWISTPVDEIPVVSDEASSPLATEPTQGL